MARHEADAKIAGDGVDHADEVGEVHPAVEVLPVGVHVLPEQGDVLIARFHKLSRLAQHVLRPAGALPSAHVGHDAVGAEVVAAVHDRQPGLHAAVSLLGDALGHGAGVLFGGEDAPAA